MVDAIDILTTYDTYPHVDAADRAREAVDLLRRTVLRRDQADDGAGQAAADAGPASPVHRPAAVQDPLRAGPRAGRRRAKR